MAGVRRDTGLGFLLCCNHPIRISTPPIQRVVALPADYILIGLSHQTAPVELRERLAVESEQLPNELSRLSLPRGSSSVYYYQPAIA